MAPVHAAVTAVHAALDHLGAELRAAGDSDPQAHVTVRRLLAEAMHHTRCAVAAAGLHPNARPVTESSRHPATIAPLSVGGQPG
jgi:hypothetical protein